MIFALLHLFSVSFAADNDDIQNSTSSTSTCTSITASKHAIPALKFKSQTLEDIEITLLSTQSQLQSAREQLSSARKDLKAAEKELKQTERTLDSFRTVITSARTARSISEPNTTPSPTISFINTRELRKHSISDSDFTFYMGIEPCLANTSVIFNHKKIKKDDLSKKSRKVIDNIYIATPHLSLIFNTELTNNEIEYKIYTHKEKDKIETTNIPCSYYKQFCNNFLTLIKGIAEIIKNEKIALCQFDEEKCAFKIDYIEELFFRFSARYYIYNQELENLRKSLMQNKPSLKKIRRLKKSLRYIDQCGNDILTSIFHYKFKELQKKRETQRAQEIERNKTTPLKKIIRFTYFKNGVLLPFEPIVTATPSPITPTTPKDPPAPPNTPTDNYGE